MSINHTACVAGTLNLLYRASANWCTKSYSNPAESQGHMSALLIGLFLTQFVISPI